MKYKDDAELEKYCVMYKNVRVIEQGEGFIIPGKCWWFASWDLVKRYIDSE